MGRGKVWLALIAGWGALSSLLVWFLKETFFSVIAEGVTGLTEKWAGRSLADMIGAATAYAIPLVGSVVIMTGVYAVAFRHGAERSHVSRSLRSDAPRKSEWLPPSDAVRKFLDEKIVAEYEAAQSEFWRLTFDRDERGKPQHKELLKSAAVAFQRAESSIMYDLVDRLQRGTLVAKGTQAPITRSSRERTMPTGWWSFLVIDLTAGTAEGEGIKILGLMIGRPSA